MNRKSLLALKTVMALKKDTDVAVFAEKKRLLDLAYATRDKLQAELQDAQALQTDLDPWDQTKLQQWCGVMQKKLVHAGLDITKKEQAVERAREALLRSNGEVEGVKKLLDQ